MPNQIDDEAFNMSLRKFLKQVGVTSQQQIEQAVRGAKPAGNVKIRAVITIPELGLEHVIDGEIATGASE
jgi:hypothetical protein